MAYQIKTSFAVVDIFTHTLFFHQQFQHFYRYIWISTYVIKTSEVEVHVCFTSCREPLRFYVWLTEDRDTYGFSGTLPSPQFSAKIQFFTCPNSLPYFLCSRCSQMDMQLAPLAAQAPLILTTSNNNSYSPSLRSLRSGLRPLPTSFPE